jgi:hypothetical protein
MIRRIALAISLAACVHLGMCLPARGAEELREQVPIPVDTCQWARQIVAREIGRGAERIAGYERYGHFCLDIQGKPRNVEPDARAFLWSHWGARKRGVAILTLHSIEGEPSTMFMYVEPSSDGHWRLRVTIDRLLFTRKPSPDGKCVHVRSAYTASVIHRVEIPHDGRTSRQFLDDSIAREPGTYRLSIHPDDGARAIEF